MSIWKFRKKNKKLQISTNGYKKINFINCLQKNRKIHQSITEKARIKSEYCTKMQILSDLEKMQSLSENINERKVKHNEKNVNFIKGL